MNCKFRYPLASIVLMAVTFALILIQLAQTNALLPIGGAVLLMLVGAYAGGAVVWLILQATNRAGSCRFAEVRTWPK